MILEYDVPGRRSDDDAFLAGGGVMGARMRAYDWSGTPLGDPGHWPQSLRTVIRILLSSRYAMWMAWGPELTFFCNDAYKPTLGAKEGWALGSRADRVWGEIWPDIGPRIDRVLRTGEATWDEALLLFLERSGYLEETYHTFSYSPLANDEGVTTGMLCVVTEVTDGVIGERRLNVLRELGASLAGAKRKAEVLDAIERSLLESKDLPFAVAYEPDRENRSLVRITPLTADAMDFAPQLIALGSAKRMSPVERVLEDGEPLLLDDLSSRFPDAPTGAWDSPPQAALVLPISNPKLSSFAGVFIAGLNPYRPLDDGYRGFINLFVGQIAAALTAAGVVEEEVQRAEALAAIDRAKTAFFSNVSHEFRTPLTLMLGPLEEALGRANLDAHDAALVNVAHRNGLRLQKLVNSLLDFSRIEAGRMRARFELTDVGRFTAELASSFRSATDRAGLDLSVESGTSLCSAYIDRDMWENVVLNLLSNAFKFTFDGRIAVAVTADDAGLRMDVSDTGVGIAASELPRLFERFHRVEGARSRSSEGSGIGLALVNDLVRLHGGRIEVASTPGAGSTFSVFIPFGRGHLPPDQVFDDATDPSIATRARAHVEEALRWLPRPSIENSVGRFDATGSEVATPLYSLGEQGHVLLADDNADMREYVERLLVQNGFRVTAAVDGAEALAAAREARPDLVLSDVMMPRLDGFGLLRALRADAALEDLPVILLSARAGEESRVQGLDAGADDYLVKPFSSRELLARVGGNIKLARARREAAEALRRLNEHLAEQVEQRTEERDRAWRNSQDLMAVIDERGILRSVNPAWKTILDYDESELLGHRFDEFMHPDDVTATEHAHVQATRADRPAFENRYRNKDGGYRWISWVASPAGGVIYAFGRNITAEKENADALRKTEEALIQARKVEAMGQLTGGVAHDFNNLLTPIVGALDLLRRRGVGEEREKRLIAGAIKSAERARILVQRLLAFARRQPLQATVVDIGKLVEGMAELLTSTVGPRIELVVDIAADAPAAKADANQLEMAILNLVVNARDAMPDGGRLRIGIAPLNLAASEHELDPGAYVTLSVRDSGIGMDKATLARATEPFFSTKGVGQGTGLGLSMVHGLAAQSGGGLIMTSAPSEGTEVRLVLTIARQEEPVAERPAASPPEKAAGRVLLVDDEEHVRSTTAEMLRELGYTVIEASSGHEALELIERGAHVEIVLTDHLMPGMTGLELSQIVRKRRAAPHVVIMSGYASHDGLDPGFARLTKPFRHDELAARMMEVIGR